MERSEVRGTGKLNTSVINENQYKAMIKNLIHNTIKEYQGHRTDDLFFDCLKMRIKESSIKYGIYRSRNKNTDLRDIETKINELDRIIGLNQNVDINLKIERESLQSKLNLYFLEKTEGARI